MDNLIIRQSLIKRDSKKHIKERQFKTKRAKNQKLLLMQMRGSRCELCGIPVSFDPLALKGMHWKSFHFHHLDPHRKCFKLSQCGSKNSIDILKEFVKTILVCSNCHVHVESGNYQIPEEFWLRWKHEEEMIQKMYLDNVIFDINFSEGDTI